MQLAAGQLIIILAPYLDYEIYATIKQLKDDNIMLEMKTDVEIPFDREILCMAVEGENIFEFYTHVIAKKDKIIFVKLPEFDGYSAIEKRKFNRVDCRIGFVATPISINNIQLTNNDKKFTGTIRNISGGGVMIETSLNLPPEMVFAFKLKLNFFMDCKAKIVRTIALDKSTYQCGCEFVENTLENVKNISLFAFREKLKQKRRELNQRRTVKGGKE